MASPAGRQPGSAQSALHRHDGEMDAAVTPLLQALDAGQQATLVRITSLRGFGLRNAGDGAVVCDGALAGSILSGLADVEILEAAASSGERRTLRATITDRAADDAGMVCGGAAHLLLSPVADLPPGFAELLRSARPLALVTPSDGTSNDIVVTRRDVLGDPAVFGPDADAVVELARAQIATGATATQEHELESATFVISTVIPQARGLIVGSGPMATAIQAQGELLGWEVTIDESVDFAKDFLTTAGPADAVIVLSHDASVDVPILDTALASAVGYIGGMGSRGTQTRRRTSLTEAGHALATLQRIHGPIGLDLGSRTPSETAVAIVAEYLANRSGRAPGRLTDGAGPING